MRRILTGRWMQLIAALVLLAGIGAIYTWAADHLLPWPRMSLQLDNNRIMIPNIDMVIVTPAISPDGKLLAATTNNSSGSSEESALVLWDLETGKHRRLASFDWTDARDIEFSPDGKLLAAKSKGYELKIWDTSDGKLRLEKVLEHPGQIGAGLAPGDPDVFVRTRFSPDGRYLLFQPRRSSDPIIFWDIQTDREWTRIDGEFTALRFAPDGKHFAILDRRYQDPEAKDRLNVSLWEMPADDSLPRKLKRQQIVVKDSDFLEEFVFSNDLQTCALACTHNDAQTEIEIQLWDLSTNEETARLLHRHTELGHLHFDVGKLAYCLEFSPNGRFLMATFEGGATVDWNVKHVTWNAQGELQAVHVSHGLAFVSPCGRWILSQDSTGADILEVGTLRKRPDLRRQTDHDPGLSIPHTGLPPWTDPPAAHYQFSPDGHFVMVTGFQTTMTPNPMEMVLTGQWSRINTPETVPVGRLWDVERGEEIASFHDCDEATFSPDSHTLVTFHSDNSVRFWTVPLRRRLGLILTLTTISWGLFLLACGRVKRRLRRGRRSTVSMSPQTVAQIPATQP